MAGRVAVILGSSRGLGAAIGRAVKFRGASVFGMARSGNPGEPSGIEAGDAADPLALRRLRERVSGEHGRLDFLVCNACPPVLPLFLEPNAAERIGAYIERAVSLTLAPLTEFLELLNRSGGCAVIISSVYVEHPVKEFPHYIAAKRAVEALASIASMQCPRVATLIVRPPKLLTAMTNTPIGRLGAYRHRVVPLTESPRAWKGRSIRERRKSSISPAKPGQSAKPNSRDGERQLVSILVKRRVAGLVSFKNCSGPNPFHSHSCFLERIAGQIRRNSAARNKQSADRRFSAMPNVYMRGATGFLRPLSNPWKRSRVSLRVKAKPPAAF